MPRRRFSATPTTPAGNEAMKVRTITIIIRLTSASSTRSSHAETQVKYWPISNISRVIVMWQVQLQMSTSHRLLVHYIVLEVYHPSYHLTHQTVRTSFILPPGYLVGSLHLSDSKNWHSNRELVLILKMSSQPQEMVSWCLHSFCCPLQMWY